MQISNSISIWNNNIAAFSGGGASYLVDDYSPVLAFSLRKVSSTATVAIRVRRTSDNAEQDIGFSGNDLDTASLESFCSGTDGHAVKFYNQGTGGATYDATQTTTGNQPQIVSSGTTLTSVNGKPALLGNGTSYKFQLTTGYVAPATAFGAISVYDRASTGINNTAFGNYNNYTFGLNTFNTANQVRILRPSSVILESSADTGSQLIITYHNGTNALMNRNGTNKYDAAYTLNSATLNSIMTAYVDEHNGYFQEAIYIQSDITSDVSAIETNVNTYYSIY